MLSTINPKSFCIGPWSEIRIDADGSMNFCHAASSDMIPPEDNISEIGVLEYFTESKSVHSARSALSQGGKVERCYRCYQDEQNGLISNRQRRNLQAAIFPGPDLIPSAHEAWPRMLNWTKPRFYHVSLSNLCNMACLMCDAKLSSLLAATQRSAGVINNETPILRDWTQNETVWQKFVQHLLENDQIACLHFMGGEPMYHKRFWQVLDTLIDHNHCDFALTFVTNGTRFDDTIVTKLKRFRSVAVEISIESLDSSNDYIRHPSHHSDIEHNIQNYLDHRCQEFDVVLRSVPQLLSAPRYDRLLEFALDHRVMIDSNVLYSPAFMAANMLPESIKQQVVDRLGRFVKHQTHTAEDLNLRNISDLQRSLSIHAQKIIDQINLPCADVDDKWKSLVDYCKKMDRVRNLDVTEMVPDLAEHFINRGYHSD